jgi:hypothetical protein
MVLRKAFFKSSELQTDTNIQVNAKPKTVRQPFFSTPKNVIQTPAPAKAVTIKPAVPPEIAQRQEVISTQQPTSFGAKIKKGIFDLLGITSPSPEAEAKITTAQEPLVKQFVYNEMKADPIESNGFLNVFKDNFIPTQFIQTGDSKIVNEARKQVTEEYQAEHPYLSIIPAAMGTLANLLLIGKAGGGLGLSEKVATKAGSLGNLMPTLTRVTGLGAESASIFGIESFISEALNQAKNKKFEPVKLLTETAKGSGTGLLLGGAGALPTLPARVIGAGTTMAGLSTLEGYIQDGKIDSKDLTNIGINAVVGMAFEGFGGRTKTKMFKEGEMMSIAKESTIQRILEGNKGMPRAEAERLAGLIDQLGFMANSGIYENVPASSFEQMNGLPADFFAWTKDAKTKYFNGVSSEIAKGKTISQAIEGTNKTFGISAGLLQNYNTLKTLVSTPAGQQNNDLISQYQRVAEAVKQYTETNKENVLTNDTTTIDVVKMPDGQYASAFTLTVPDNNFSSQFSTDTLFSTKEAAVNNAKKEIINYTKSYLGGEEAKKIYEGLTQKVETKIPTTKLTQLGFLEVELPVASAVEATSNEGSVSSGFHSSLNNLWTIVYKNPSKKLIKVAEQAGLNVSTREAPVGSGQILTDITLPNIGRDEIEKATKAFNRFAELYDKAKANPELFRKATKAKTLKEFLASMGTPDKVDYETLTDFYNKTKGAEVTKKEVISPKQKISTARNVKKLEKELSAKYAENKDLAEEKLGEVWTELMGAQAGERIAIRGEDGRIESWLGSKSSFPDYVPSEYRDKKQLNIVMEGLTDLTNIKYPTGNKSARRTVLNIVLDELDKRLNIDTSEIRQSILDEYGSIYQREVSKGVSSSVERSKGKRERGGEINVAEMFGEPTQKEKVAQVVKPRVEAAAGMPRFAKPKEVVINEQAIEDFVNNKKTKFRTANTKELIISAPKRELTSKFFEHSDIKGKEYASYPFLYNLSKSDSFGLKKIEREIIQNVLDTQYKDEKRIDMVEFKKTVIGDMLPLEVIKSSSYANYGADNVQLGDLKHTTYILNSPFEHGNTAEFPSDYEKTIPLNDLEIKEIPVSEQNKTPKFAVVRKGVVFTEENIEANVFDLSSRREDAEEWIKSHTLEGFGDDITNKQVFPYIKKGFFSHFRTFDEVDTRSPNTNLDRGNAVSHIAEIQSQPIQHDSVHLTASKRSEMEKSIQQDKENKPYLENKIISAKESIDNLKIFSAFVKSDNFKKEGLDKNYNALAMLSGGEEKKERLIKKYNLSKYNISKIRDFYIFTERNNVREAVFSFERAEKWIRDELKEEKDILTRNENRMIEDQKRLDDKEKELLSMVDEVPGKEEKLFLSYWDIWQERTVREAIYIKANEGFKTLRFPTPRTVAVIEGYTGAGGGNGEYMPYEIINGSVEDGLIVGDTINFEGDEYTVLSADDNSITVALSKGVTHFDAQDAMDEDIENRWDEVVYDFGKVEKDFGKIKTAEDAQNVVDKIDIYNREIEYQNKAKNIKEEKERTKNALKPFTDKEKELQTEIDQYTRFIDLLEKGVMTKEKINEERIGDQNFKDKLEKKYNIEHAYWNYIYSVYSASYEPEKLTINQVTRETLKNVKPLLKQAKEKLVQNKKEVITLNKNAEERIKEIQDRKKPTDTALATLPKKLLTELKSGSRDWSYNIDFGTENALNQMTDKDPGDEVDIEDYKDNYVNDEYENYDNDFEGMYETGKVFYEEKGRDNREVWITEDDTQTLSQPDQYDQTSSIEDFNIENFEGSNKTVLLFYEKQVNKYLAKLRKDNLELITDDNDYQWLETKITPEDKEAPTAYRLKDDMEKAGLPITDAQEQEIINLNKEIFGDTDISIVGQILANKKALGSYKKGMIEILSKQVNPKDTFYHEVGHKYLDVASTKTEYVEALKEAQKKYKINDIAEVDERMVEDFIPYANSRQGVFGKLKIFFDKVLLRIEKYFGAENRIETLYNDILSGKAAKQPRFAKKVGQTVGQGVGQGNIAMFNEGTPTIMGGVDQIRPIQTPEMVELVREITGNVPVINSRLRTKLGVFWGRGKGEIQLRPDIFRDPIQVAKTLAHEIGHLVDWLPRFGIKRTSLLQKLTILKNHIKGTFGDDIVKNKDIKEELWNLSTYWRPLGAYPTPAFMKYRRSANELYADAISVLFNSPGLLEQKAPIFYKAFFASLDEKADINEKYWEIQDLLYGAKEELFKARESRISKGFERASDIQQGFRDKKEKTDNRLVERLRQQLDDRYYPDLKKVQQAEARGEIIDDNNNPKYLLQELAWASNENYLFVDQVDKEISKPVKEAGMTDDDIGFYLLLNRIKTERKEIANPYGFDVNTASEQLDYMRQRLGEDKFKLLQDKVALFHEIVFKSVEEAVRVGAYNKELFETTIKPNKENYATFSVVDYLQDYVSATVKKQVGTFKEVANPFHLTILKTAALNKLNITQRAKNSMRDLLLKSFPAEIAPSKKIGGRISIFKTNREEKLSGQLKLLEDGKLMSYDVDPYIAQSFNYDHPEVLEVATNLLGKINQVFKSIVTTYNLGFAVAFNPIRDFKRNYKNIKGASVASLAISYAKSFPSAVRYAKGNLDDFTKQMVADKLMNAPIYDYNYDPRDDEMGEILKKYGVISNNTTEKELPSVMQKARTFLLKPVIKTLDAIRFVANTFEIVSKIAGTKVRMAQGETGKELAYNVRNYTGTPNWKTKGTSTYITNELFIFSNIMKEGLKSDYQIATNPNTRSGYWWKTIKMDILPKFLMFLAALGVFGEWVKDQFDKMTEYDKTNYITIPLGTRNGKAVYARIPHDETGRLISAIFWKVLNFAKDRNINGLQDIFALGAGQLPTVTPVINFFQAWTQFLSGKNPYDAFRGRTLISDTVFQAGGMPALKKMVQWSANNFGLSQFTTYDPSKNDTIELAVQILPLLNRILKISDYGLSEKSMDLTNEIKTQRAREVVAEKEVIDKYVAKYKDDYKTGKADLYTIGDEIVKEALGHEAITDDELSRDKSMRTRLKTSMVVGAYDARVDNLVYAASNREKIALLKQYQTEMVADQFNDLVWLLYEEKIISGDVLDAIGK